MKVYESRYPRAAPPPPVWYVRPGERPQASKTEGPMNVANIVSVFELDTPVSLFEFCRVHTFCEFQPKTFASVKIHLMYPHTTCLLSSSSKAVCTGARDMYTSYLAALEYAKMIAEVTGGSAEIVRFACVNQTAVVHTGRALDLDTIAGSLSSAAKYVPVNFPCAFVYVWPKSDVRHIISVRGSVVITGARSKYEIRRSVERMMPVYERNSAEFGSERAEAFARNAANAGQSSRPKKRGRVEEVDETDVEALLELDRRGKPAQSAAPAGDWHNRFSEALSKLQVRCEDGTLISAEEAWGPIMSG